MDLQAAVVLHLQCAEADADATAVGWQWQQMGAAHLEQHRQRGRELRKEQATSALYLSSTAGSSQSEFTVVHWSANNRRLPIAGNLRPTAALHTTNHLTLYATAIASATHALQLTA